MIANILKFIQSNDMIKIALILFAFMLIINYTKIKNESMENYLVPEYLENVSQGDIVQMETAPVQKDQEKDQQQEQVDAIVSKGDEIKPSDLLPDYKAENEFSKENPVTKLLKEQNFLISGYHVGINTVMQSNKIPYHDIRSLPPIPKESVGPWNQSSFEQSPAQMRRFFEIGV